MKVKKKRKGLNLVALIFFILVAVLYLINEKYPLKSKSEEPYVSVIKVYDGDTVSVKVDRKQEKIRLIGIDAPEMGQEPWGENAKRYLENLLDSSDWEIRLEYDIEKRDQYNRLLAYIWTKDNKNVNLLMLKSGYAVLYTFPPNVKYVEEFRVAQKEAREKEIGIWSTEGLKELPQNYRKEHPRF
ncbi:MAG: thermonuclease family protein [Nitrospirae bacterium]|nr:thermonuclease family protein [Nitrospirota bacterium]